MKVYATVNDVALGPDRIENLALRAEQLGFDGLVVAEGVHDSFILAALALRATERLQVMTGVALAFTRSPMSTAIAAWDLASMSDGRFELGLGSQVKGNITRRYGMPWSAPAARMTDYLGALRACWRAFQSGERLDYHSDAYTLDRLQPFFNPGPIAQPDIPVYLGAVQPGMLRVAGCHADGIITHPTNSSPLCLRERLRPPLDEGTKSKGQASGPAVIASCFVATGANAAAVAAEREQMQQLLGFLFSTPQYWPTLELHGWSELGEKLLAATRAGDWQNMNELVDERVLAELVFSGTHDELAPLLLDAYRELATGITLRLSADSPGNDEGQAADRGLAGLVAGLQAG
jgi:probable F420-dependent oxidoreductase